MKWIDREKGPECFCGMPTAVVVMDNGAAHLMCIFHTNAEGATFPLPKDSRPENWSNLTDIEMDALMLQGQNEDEGNDE